MIRSSREIPPEEVAAHYDELDCFYRDIWGDHVHHGYWRTGKESRETAVHQLVETIVAQGGIEKGMRICDAGCGYGATARTLARDFGAQVTAVTVSAAQQSYAAQLPRQPGDPEYLLRDWMENGLDSSSFDAVIAIESSEHMPSLERFFSESARVLKPGGCLVVCAWLSCDAPAKWQQRWLLEPICREGKMPQMGTVEDYKRLAAAAGFHCREMLDATREVRRTWPRIMWAFLWKLLRQPRYIRFLFLQHANNRIFALTALRLWFSYATGAMRYGIFRFG